MRPGLWLLLVLASGCRPSAAPPPSKPSVEVPAATNAPVAPAASTEPRADANEMLATLRIDERPGGKKFQGVWLERDDGEKWVISYRPHDIWRSFDGQRVRVRGAIYQPNGQQIHATHFRVDWLGLAGRPESGIDLVEVKEEKTYRGMFQEHGWPAGSKLEGEKTVVFSSEGTAYFLANPVERIKLDESVEVRGREVVPSPYMARPGGPFLWILDR